MPFTVPLKSEFLLRQRCFVRGAWTGADDGRTLTVRNPLSGAVIGTVPRTGAAEARRAVQAAADALPAWRARAARERAAILRRWSGLIVANQEDLATLAAAEQGATMAESRGEVARAAGFVEWFAEEATRVSGDTMPQPGADRRLLVFKEPVGVVAAITPWCGPATMVTRKAGPALAAGCTVVLKPASAAPFTALALAGLGEQAGLPAGVFNVVTGDPEAIGRELATNPMVRKVSFTGSAEVGREVMLLCASTLKPVSLEVGGTASFIVFDDADLDAAAAGVAEATRRHPGRAGAGAVRVLAQEGVHGPFARRLAALAAPAPDQGPPREAAAPAPPLRFRTEEEAVRLANDAGPGLACCLFTRDLARSWRLAERLECGTVGLNTGLAAAGIAPFGGRQESGAGRERSRRGIEEYLESKYVCIGGIT
jgi:succinate-semialdehyde dehydrogenase/glutarate-semialdehyde dehydrogenase